MTHERDIERLLDTWFSDGPTETPDRVIDTVADRIARQPQRPAWRLTWRHHPLNAYLKPLALVAATILVAFLGFNLVGGFKTNSDVAAPSPSPSATATPSPSPTPPSPSASAVAFDCSGGSTGCAGPLTAGDHASANMVVPFTFTVPDGWTNTRDVNRTYSMETSSGIATPAEVMAMNAIAEQTPECGPTAKAGAGNAVQDFVNFLREHPGLVTTEPVPVEMDGYRGQSVDLSVASTWTATCPDSTGPFVLLLTDTGSPAGRALGYPGDVKARWDILDVNGKTVIIERVGDPVAGKFDEAAAAAQPIIDSIRFTPPN